MLPEIELVCQDGVHRVAHAACGKGAPEIVAHLRGAGGGYVSLAVPAPDQMHRLRRMSRWVVVEFIHVQAGNCTVLRTRQRPWAVDFLPTDSEPTLRRLRSGKACVWCRRKKTPPTRLLAPCWCLFIYFCCSCMLRRPLDLARDPLRPGLQLCVQTSVAPLESWADATLLQSHTDAAGTLSLQINLAQQLHQQPAAPLTLPVVLRQSQRDASNMHSEAANVRIVDTRPLWDDPHMLLQLAQAGAPEVRAWMCVGDSRRPMN